MAFKALKKCSILAVTLPGRLFVKFLHAEIAMQF